MVTRVGTDTPMMYIGEFLELLTKHNIAYRQQSPDLPPQWDINCVGHIRTNTGACPITHLFDMEKGTGRFQSIETYYPPDHWSDCARDMGMPSDRAKEVMKAADATSNHDVDLRKQILAACFLEDKAYKKAIAVSPVNKEGYYDPQ